jgi:hypothetical protein
MYYFPTTLPSNGPPTRTRTTYTAHCNPVCKPLNDPSHERPKYMALTEASQLGPPMHTHVTHNTRHIHVREPLSAPPRGGPTITTPTRDRRLISVAKTPGNGVKLSKGDRQAPLMTIEEWEQFNQEIEECIHSLSREVRYSSEIADEVAEVAHHSKE